MNKTERMACIQDIHHCLSLLVRSTNEGLDRMTWDTENFKITKDKGYNNVTFSCNAFEIICYLSDEDDIIELKENYSDISTGESCLWYLIYAMLYNEDSTSKEYYYEDFRVNEKNLTDKENEKEVKYYLNNGDYNCDEVHNDPYPRHWPYYCMDYYLYRHKYNDRIKEEDDYSWYLDGEEII